MEEQELVRRVQAGDEDAVTELHARYVDAVFRYLVAQTSSYHDSEELLQDVFYRAAVKLDTYNGRAALKTWLFKIARNAVIDYYRRTDKEKNVVLAADPRPEDAGRTEENAETVVMRGLHMEDVERCMEQMTEDHRQVLHLRFVEDLSLKETAAILGRTTLSVKALQWRARQKLKECIGTEVMPGDTE
ncbi:RNA polymerase sigma factor [Alkalicoccus urumqiensis]|uniref:RNA polymerase sigma factor n=1 Tax=Alkalicoccus urumqiensis TaxID=1548213 RepID=A0A2P6MHQ3_ALKUR|nr:RNA polymerase sigma factor [Alkalicoccus urumqiensis]PRO65783.1 RNA polymerase sigma factor [Alkalicoccus urumqiensis]